MKSHYNFFYLGHNVVTGGFHAHLKVIPFGIAIKVKHFLKKAIPWMQSLYQRTESVKWGKFSGPD